MRESEKLLIHALAIHAQEPGKVCARVTVRLGEPTPGDHVQFEGTDRVVRVLEIICVEQSNHLLTLTLTGTEENLQHLVGGMYLCSVENQS